MAAKGEVKYRLTLDPAGFKSGAAQAKTAFTSLHGSVTKGAEQMAGKLGPVGGLLMGLGPAGLAGAAGLVAVGGAATLMVGKISDGIRAATDLGGRLIDMRDKTGMSVESLQRLGFAASQSGSSIEAVAKGVNIFQRTLVTGGKEVTEALDRIGLSQRELIEMAPEDAFVKVGEAIRGLESPTLQAATAMKLFGKSGAELLPMIKAGMAEAADEADRLGIVMSGETAEAMDLLGDKWDALGEAWDGLWRNLGAPLAQSPEVVEAVQAITDVVAGLSQMILQAGPAISDLAKSFKSLRPTSTSPPREARSAG